MAALGPGAALSFRDTLARHLEAIQGRDLAALADTVARDALIVVTAEGRLVREAREFLDMHRDWFASPHWRLFATPVEIVEGADLGVAVFHLLYRETAPRRPEVRSQSHLTLVFARRDGKWVMVLDQNTPVR